jgi:hypothetical protein
MIKRDLLFAGLLLMGVTAFAQQKPTFDEKLDAKQIFFQNFEAGWDEWSTTAIDSITVLEYYDHQGTDNGTSFKPWSDPENWKKGIIRTDSTMILYNGIKPTDNPNEMPDKNNNFPNEVYGTVKDIDAARTEAMSNFGEADKGGEYVLSYTSDTCTLAANTWGTYKGGYTANYRRNLFVRGLPIEDSTSYRLTFYVKANRVAGHNRSESKPRLSAGVFRGYYHAEKPFSMGIENDNDHNKYNAQFEYTKDEFTGEWEKINLMTYYINDSIANNFVFVDGYWWANGDWTWKASSTGTSNPKDYDLNYIVQPDKFFVRLGFVSDYTEFKVDNLSLTKSWIAGCEYDKDKMRVDFGYKTNLGALAKAAYEKNKIDAVEVVNTNNKYVDVWGQKDDNSWERVPINSIEYHGDGYMYLFTPSRVVNGQTVKVQFKSYKQVLVTFRNPVDQPELALKYTGKGNSATEGFPMGTDTAWIKAGKVVPNFYNELATPNPNIFDGVYSMKELPPVMQESEFEDGSFGLDPSKRTLWFKFSRQVEMDNLGEDSPKLIAYVGTEVWTPSWDAENSRVVLTRPEGKTAPLAGDVKIELVKIYGIGTAKADDVTVNFHFGAFERKPSVFSKTTDWKSQVTGTSRPYPTSVYVHSGTDPFKKGDGANSPGKCGLYNMNGDGQYNAGFYLSSRTDGATGNLYSIETLTAGDYTISFRALGWGAKNKALTVKIFAKPEGEIVDGDANGFALLNGVQNKTVIGTQATWDASISSAGDWKEGYKDLSYSFTVPANGDYVIEFFTSGSGNYEGVIFSNYAIKSYAGLPGLCTVPLNESVDAAKARIALAKGENDADLAVNGGSIYDALVAKVAFYDYNPEGGFKANGAYPTDPTSWKNAKKDLDDATNLLKLRMDTVKAFTDKRAAVAAKLEANATVADLSTYKLLQAKADTANAYPVTTKGGKEIYAFNDRMQKAIDALDARLALNKKLSDELTKAKNLIEDTEAKKDFEEYTELQAAYNANKDCDLINSLDDAINATYDAVHSAIYDYQFRVLRLQYATVRMHKLDSIAAKLGSDIVDNETVKAGLAAIEEDDPALAAIYISAIKIALYEKLDTDDAIYDEDSLDITPFISNYNLYQTPKILEKMDLQMPKNSGDMAVIGPKGENMLHTRHQYNENGNMPIWVIVPEQDITDLYPGWTVRAFRTGNTMVTGDKSYNNYKNDVPVFDGEIGMDWNCKAELKQDLANLPVGLYTLGVELPEIKNNGSDKVITLKGNDKSAVMNDKNATVGALTIDSIAVTDSLKIDLVVMSENGWSRADNFTLAFRPDKSFEYGDAIAAEQANLTELLTIVNSAKAVAANVEYFTLGGVQVAAPKAGQILIRKTTNANGKVVTDKVLLK